VLILVAAYRGGVKETASSGTFAVGAELGRRGATALVSDPLFDADELRTLGLEPWDGAPVGATILRTGHTEYRRLTRSHFPGGQSGSRRACRA